MVPSCESTNFRWIPTWQPNSQGNPHKAPLREIPLSEYSSKGFWVGLGRLSEYSSVAYLVERPIRETPTEQSWATAQVKRGSLPPKTRTVVRPSQEATISLRNFEKGALEKGYVHKFVRNWLPNLQQIRDNFAHPWLPNLQQIGFLWRGEISIILIQSYINSIISQGFDARLIIATGARATPIIEISQKPPFGNPQPLCVARSDIPAIFRKFDGRFGTNLRNAPFAGFLIVQRSRQNFPWVDFGQTFPLKIVNVSWILPWIYSCLFFRGKQPEKIHRENQTPKSTAILRGGVSLTKDHSWHDYFDFSAGVPLAPCLL